MCMDTSETVRPRFFSGLSVILVTAWVLLVSVVAHSVEPSEAAQKTQIEEFIMEMTK